jgi:hypothetical protein
LIPQVPCKDYKKLAEIDEERCLDCDFHLDCFPMDRGIQVRQMELEEAFAEERVTVTDKEREV